MDPNAPQSNPANQARKEPESSSENVAGAEEVAIAQWTEPSLNIVGSRFSIPLITLTGVIATVGSVGLGLWLKQFNFYLLAAVIAVAATTLVLQRVKQTPGLTITLTNFRVIIGKREKLLTDLAGFWLEKNGDQIGINLETKKPGLMPTSFLASTPNESEARDTMRQILPELEPREEQFSDRINRTFRF